VIVSAGLLVDEKETTLVKNIADWRHELDISQQELATMIEVSVSVVSKWERGIHMPGKRTQRALVRAFTERSGVSLTSTDIEWPR
jgi:DNA-binding transcriptional regulator YiaG